MCSARELNSSASYPRLLSAETTSCSVCCTQRRPSLRNRANSAAAGLFFRFIYEEVVTANGGTYNALLNTTSKRTAAFAACLGILSYHGRRLRHQQRALSQQPRSLARPLFCWARSRCWR